MSENDRLSGMEPTHAPARSRRMGRLWMAGVTAAAGLLTCVPGAWAAAGDANPGFGSSSTGVTVTAVASGGQADGATAIARESDGSYAAVGSGADNSGNPVPEVAHYTSTGKPDTSFGSNGLAALPTNNGDILFGPKIAYQPSTGELIVAGTWESPSNTYGPGDYGMVRLKPDGSLDTTFGTNGIVDTKIYQGGGTGALTVDPSSGTIYLGGWAPPSPGAENDATVVSYAPDGTNASLLLADGESGGGAEFEALALDGSNLVAAGSLYTNSGGQAIVERIDASSGNVDSAFNSGKMKVVSLGAGAYSGGYAVLIQPSHKIVLGGFGSNASGSGCQGLARLNSDGSLDTTFGSGGVSQACVGDDGSAYGIAFDGTYLYAAGNTYNNSTSTNRTLLTRWTADGALDTSFGSGGLVISDPVGAGNDSTANAIVLDGANNPVLAGQAHDKSSNTIYYALESFLGTPPSTTTGGGGTTTTGGGGTTTTGGGGTTTTGGGGSTTTGGGSGGTPQAAPSALTGTASSVTDSSAVLHGLVSANGSPISWCFFEYDADALYNNPPITYVNCTETVGEGNGVSVSAPVSGLVPGAVYHYRLIAANRLGTAVGSDATLTTVQPTTDLPVDFRPYFGRRQLPWNSSQATRGRLHFWPLAVAERGLQTLMSAGGWTVGSRAYKSYTLPRLEGRPFSEARDSVVYGCKTRSCTKSRLAGFRPYDIYAQNPDPQNAQAFKGTASNPATVRIYYWDPALDKPSHVKVVPPAKPQVRLPDLLNVSAVVARDRLQKAGISAVYSYQDKYGAYKPKPHLDDVVGWAINGDWHHSSLKHPVKITLDLWEGPSRNAVNQCRTDSAAFDKLLAGLHNEDLADVLRTLNQFHCKIVVQTSQGKGDNAPVQKVSPGSGGTVTVHAKTPAAKRQDLFLIIRPAFKVATPAIDTLAIGDWAVPSQPALAGQGGVAGATRITVQVIDRAGRFVRGATVQVDSGATLPGAGRWPVTDGYGEVTLDLFGNRAGVPIKLSAIASARNGALYGFATLASKNEGSTYESVLGQQFLANQHEYVCQIGPQLTSAGAGYSAGCVQNWVAPLVHGVAAQANSCAYNNQSAADSQYAALASALEGPLARDPQALTTLMDASCPGVSRVRLLVANQRIFPAQVALSPAAPLGGSPSNVVQRGNRPIWEVTSTGKVVGCRGWAVRGLGNSLVASAHGGFLMTGGYGRVNVKPGSQYVVNAADSEVVTFPDGSAVLYDHKAAPPAAGSQDTFAVSGACP